MSAAAAVPSGYESFEVGGAQVVAHHSVATAVREAMRERTLHAWAAAQPGSMGMRGRAIAWATTFPGGPEVVVRHSQHGGLLAALTGDRFLAPTRAPRELNAALRLAKSGVRTPEVLAYAIYPAGGPFARADVATRRLHGRSLPEAWTSAPNDAARAALVGAVAALLDALRRAEAHHPDLNVSNVLIVDAAGESESPTAAVLDVDRVEFSDAESLPVGPRNLRRLLRSMEKRAMALSPAELAMLRHSERGA